MLNKELLRVNSEKGLEYTHLIKVGGEETLVGYVYKEQSDFAPMGDLNPATLLGETIAFILCGDFMGVPIGASLYLNNSLQETQLYLGRLDTKKVVLLKSQDLSNTGFLSDESLLTSVDAGKTIKLWLGENPPLGIKDFLEGVAYVEQRATPISYVKQRFSSFKNIFSSRLACRDNSAYAERRNQSYNPQCNKRRRCFNTYLSNSFRGVYLYRYSIRTCFLQLSSYRNAFIQLLVPCANKIRNRRRKYYCKINALKGVCYA